MRVSAALLLVLLAGCTAVPAAEPVTPRPVGAPPVVRAPVLAATLAGILGQPPQALERFFGQPALDVREGQGRKLQFVGSACVLDVYFYPPQGASGQAVATHVDARLPDGRDTDRGACIAALSRR